MVIWLEIRKCLILEKVGVDSSDLSKINARFLVAGLEENTVFHSTYKEKLKVGEKKNLKQTWRDEWRHLGETNSSVEL